MSRDLFSHILRSTKKDIGEHAVIAVEDLVKILDLKKKYLYHFNFVGKTTLGFKSDSIVEASFSSTKRKSNQISTRKTIEKSAINIVKDTINSSRIKHNSMQQQLEREVCWSSARVKDDLTKYSLGLFCKNYDKRANYYTVRVGEHEWMSIFNEEFYKRKSQMDAPVFKRVRTIKIDDEGYMNCSCGKTGEYLLPCKHICAVVNDQSAFSIDMFHIRWHKQFSLFHCKEAGYDCTPAQSKLIEQFFRTTRENHYDSNGLYKGVPMKESSFLKSLSKFESPDGNDDKLKFMRDLKETSKQKPVTSSSTSLEEFKLSQISMEKIPPVDLLGDFSILSQEEFQESDIYMFPNKRISHRDDESSVYHQVIDGFEKTLDMAKTPHDIDEINTFFENFVNKRISRSNRHNQKTGSTVLFGENLKVGTRIEKRREFLYETL